MGIGTGIPEISILAAAFTLLSVASAAEPQDGGIDSLLAAMEASREGSHAIALKLTSEGISNPWLDIYRRLTRSRALLASGDTARSAATALEALDMTESPEGEGHPVRGELIGQVLRCGMPDSVQHHIAARRPGEIDNRASLLLALYQLDRGNGKAAAAYVSQVSRRGVRDEDIDLISELSRRNLQGMVDLDPMDIPALVSAAVSAGDSGTSGRLIEAVRGVGEYGWLADILEADVSARTGMERKAVSRYRAVLDSGDCPTEGKKKALMRLAGLQYEMGRYRESSASYRTYGLSYPDDTMSVSAIDRSARIEMAAGRTEKAVETWQIIAEAAPNTFEGLEAVLSMSVALMSGGREGEALAALTESLGRTSGRLRAAYLYWIIRAGGETSAASVYKRMLREESSCYLYPNILEHGDGFLSVGGSSSPASAVIDCAAASGNAASSTTYASKADSCFPHPSLGAFRALAAYRDRGRAGDCARGYISAAEKAGKAHDVIEAVYHEARSYGMEGFCLELASSRPEAFRAGDDHIGRLFPIAFLDEVKAGAEAWNVPVELVLAVIREESRFDEEAVSNAGATGLMQLMPSTGEWIGRKLGRDNITEAELFDPGFSIAAGCRYLRFLLDRSEDSIVAALAAYNAGHGRMRSWQKMCRPWDNPLSALELIGPTETRRYVRRVLDSMAAYRYSVCPGRRAEGAD